MKKVRASSGQARSPRRRTKWLLAGLAGLALVPIAAAIWLLGLVTIERHVGYFGPAFSTGGNAVYFLERRSSGVTWGFGWEHFTPPARARAWSDTLRLRRLDLSSGAVATLEAWDRTPIVGRTLSQYRGRVFNHLQAALIPRDDGSVEYRLELALPRVPTADVYRLRGLWAAGPQRQRGEWNGAPAAGPGLSQPVVDADRELFTLAGPESFPAAIVLLDHADKSIQVLQQAPAYAAQYPTGPTLASLMTISRKADHDHSREMARIQRERVAAYRAQGLTEVEALLRAGRDLRDLGYYPKPQRWVATALTPQALEAYGGLQRLDLAEMEFKVGLFPDLEQAMASPGTEIDRRFGRYLRHRDYDSSERLNTLLETGTSEFLVARAGRVFHFRLLPAEPARRRRGGALN